MLICLFFEIRGLPAHLLLRNAGKCAPRNDATQSARNPWLESKASQHGLFTVRIGKIVLNESRKWGSISGRKFQGSEI